MKQGKPKPVSLMEALAVTAFGMAAFALPVATVLMLAALKVGSAMLAMVATTVMAATGKLSRMRLVSARDFAAG